MCGIHASLLYSKHSFKYLIFQQTRFHVYKKNPSRINIKISRNVFFVNVTRVAGLVLNHIEFMEVIYIFFTEA